MELNPKHPVTTLMRENWHKTTAILMLKLGVREVEITPEDIRKLATLAGGVNIVADTRNDKFVLRLVSDVEAVELAKETGVIH